VDDKRKAIDKLMIYSVGKELDFRSLNLSQPRIQYEGGDSIGESKQIKQYIVDESILSNERIGSNIYEIVQQLEQDALIEKQKYIHLNVLDSIFKVEMSKFEIKNKYNIILFDKDTLAIQKIGNLSNNDTGNIFTRLYPIGTKGIYFIQVEAQVRLSYFFKQMLGIICVSAFMIIIVLTCVTYQMRVIKRNDKLYKKREAGVNGTIHDLKSPLNSIITMLTWLKKKTTESMTQNLIENSLSQTRHLVEDIDSLLITAREDRQKIILQKQDIKLVALVEQALKSVSIQYSHKLHTIELASDSKEISIYADPLYLINVLRNLLENSLKYSDEGVKIEISAQCVSNYIAVSVSDNGWGIEKRYIKKIFTHFYQIQHPKMQVNQGYGIGLSFAKYIVENHDGYIDVKSEIGRGSTFTFYIPNKPNN
jgi:signal transduction histidine kinase